MSTEKTAAHMIAGKNGLTRSAAPRMASPAIAQKAMVRYLASKSRSGMIDGGYQSTNRKVALGVWELTDRMPKSMKEPSDFHRRLQSKHGLGALLLPLVLVVIAIAMLFERGRPPSEPETVEFQDFAFGSAPSEPSERPEAIGAAQSMDDEPPQQPQESPAVRAVPPVQSAPQLPTQTAPRPGERPEPMRDLGSSRPDLPKSPPPGE